MSRFGASWLDLRAEADSRSRSAELTAAFAARLPAEPRLVDFGAGTGANLRWLAPRLGRERQHWTLVDVDADLLRDAAPPLPGIRVETRCLDLGGGIETLDLGRFDGVVATAFLDLVSASWLDRFVARLEGRALLVSLTVDERLDWTPADSRDPEIRRAFFAHQRGEKGFGPALGPRAAPELARRLNDAGYTVRLAEADWRLGPRDHALMAALVGLWAGAAAEADPEAAPRIAAWAERRRAQLGQGRLRARIGHRDLVGWR